MSASCLRRPSSVAKLKLAHLPFVTSATFKLLRVVYVACRLKCAQRHKGAANTQSRKRSLSRYERVVKPAIIPWPGEESCEVLADFIKTLVKRNLNSSQLKCDSLTSPRELARRNGTATLQFSELTSYKIKLRGHAPRQRVAFRDLFFHEELYVLVLHWVLSVHQLILIKQWRNSSQLTTRKIPSI